MKKPNKITKQNHEELSLEDLATRITHRETKIDIACISAVKQGMAAVYLVIEQGNDLLMARSKIVNGPRGRTKTEANSKERGWELWLTKNFPKSIRLARDYMRMADSANRQGISVLENADVKYIRDAWKILGLVPDVEAEPKQLPSINVSPIVSKLNFVAEWAVRNSEEITTWETFRRQELKIQLKPVVELFEKL